MKLFLESGFVAMTQVFFSLDTNAISPMECRLNYETENLKRALQKGTVQCTVCHYVKWPQGSFQPAGSYCKQIALGVYSRLLKVKP